MASSDSDQAALDGYKSIYFIETFLRQRGDHQTLLAIDALVLRDDLDNEEKAARIQETIQEVFSGKR